MYLFHVYQPSANSPPLACCCTAEADQGTHTHTMCSGQTSDAPGDHVLPSWPCAYCVAQASGWTPCVTAAATLHTGEGHPWQARAGSHLPQGQQLTAQRVAKGLLGQVLHQPCHQQRQRHQLGCLQTRHHHHHCQAGVPREDRMAGEFLSQAPQPLKHHRRLHT